MKIYLFIVVVAISSGLNGMNGPPPLKRQKSCDSERLASLLEAGDSKPQPEENTVSPSSSRHTKKPTNHKLDSLFEKRTVLKDLTRRYLDVWFYPETVKFRTNSAGEIIAILCLQTLDRTKRLEEVMYCLAGYYKNGPTFPEHFGIMLALLDSQPGILTREGTNAARS